MTVAEEREDDVRRRIETDRDFIAIKRFDFSLAKLEARYPNGAPNKVIASALKMEQDEVEAAYQSAILKLRAAMKVEIDEPEEDPDADGQQF